MYDEDEPVLYIRIVLISIGPRLRELRRIPVLGTWMNKGIKKAGAVRDPGLLSALGGYLDDLAI